MTRIDDVLAAAQAVIADTVANALPVPVCGWCQCRIPEDAFSPDYCDITHQRAWLLSQWPFEEATGPALRQQLEGGSCGDNEEFWQLARRLLVRRRVGHPGWDKRYDEWTTREQVDTEHILRDEWLHEYGCTAWEWMTSAAAVDQPTQTLMELQVRVQQNRRWPLSLLMH